METIKSPFFNVLKEEQCNFNYTAPMSSSLFRFHLVMVEAELPLTHPHPSFTVLQYPGGKTFDSLPSFSYFTEKRRPFVYHR